MALWRLCVRQEGYRTIEDLEADLTSMVNLLLQLRHLVRALAVKPDLTSRNGHTLCVLRISRKRFFRYTSD
jgi:hypothetical protein